MARDMAHVDPSDVSTPDGVVSLTLPPPDRPERELFIAMHRVSKTNPLLHDHHETDKDASSPS